MREFPLEAMMDDGSRIPIWPSRTIGVAPIGEDGTRIWFFDDKREVQVIEMEGDREAIREALGITDPAPDDDAALATPSGRN